jgi:hypothetical protein
VHLLSRSFGSINTASDVEKMPLLIVEQRHRLLNVKSDVEEKSLPSTLVRLSHGPGS